MTDASDKWREALLAGREPPDLPAEPPRPPAPSVDLGARRAPTKPSKPTTDELWHRAVTAADMVRVDPRLAARIAENQRRTP